jgi:hypothetical protein
MNHKNYLFICFVALITCCQFTLAKKWSVLIYADCQDKLSDAFMLNMNALMRASISPNVRICVHMHAYDDVAWRYRVEQGKLIQEHMVSWKKENFQDIINAAQWAFQEGDADNHCLIFWGHGFGILEPHWDETSKEWMAENDDAYKNDCQIRSRKNFHLLDGHRAVLLNSLNSSYMTNDDMVDAVKNISQDVLHGRKIDIVGFDCCLGASIEHAYQLAPWTHYLIGCQNCELKDGFEYCGFAHRLSASDCSPLNIVKGMISDYGVYYEVKAERGEFTLSAFDCNKAPELKKIVDEISAVLCKCIHNKPKIKDIIKRVRRSCHGFCFVPMYTDLYQIVEELELAVLIVKEQGVQENLVIELQKSLDHAKQCIRNSIVANVTGENMSVARGISIYFPLSHIDSSYYQVKFAQEGKWLELLKLLVV